MANENESKKRIILYLKNNKDNLSPAEKRLLVNYLTQLSKYDIENVENETIEDIFIGITYLSKKLYEMKNTTLNKERTFKLLKLSQDIQYHKLVADNKKIKEISREIDKLYMDLDLPPRENSSFSYNLEEESRFSK